MEYILTKKFISGTRKDLPLNTVFKQDTGGSFCPDNVLGYESKADYPDGYWIKPWEKINTNFTKNG